MILLKPTSRTVHHCREEENQLKNTHNVSNNESSISLTVWTKSLLYSCNGFTVFGPDGNLIYRVDNYKGGQHHVVLMDGSGVPIFTIRKKLGIVRNYWILYEGDVERSSNTKNSQILWAMKKINVRQEQLNVLAYVYGVTKSTKTSFLPSIWGGMCHEKRHKYVVQGSYTHRSCKIMDESRTVVAEIKEKEARSGGVFFGVDVFHLIVKSGIESRFAMAIVLLLDQMCS